MILNRHNILKMILPAIMLMLYANVVCSQTALYNQYKHRTDIRVACIMQYPLTDSLKTDITLFEPKTKEDLWPMVQEFGLGLDKDEVYNYFEKEERYTLYSYNVRKDNIKKCFGPITSNEDYKNMSILAYNYNMGIIIIFHDINTEDRCDIIERFLIKTLKQPDLLPKTTNGIDNK